MKGNIHSIESFGTVDGPGIRYVIFMQGCPMRCAYCHNPDTWQLGVGEEYSESELLEDIVKYKRYIDGITVSGGEPLMQIDFLIDLFKIVKDNGLTTCLDTSGILFDKNNPQFVEKLDKLLTFCDLVILDIKHIDDEKHRGLTGFSNKNVLEFAKYIDSKNIKIWLRYVLVPTINDEDDIVEQWKNFANGLNNVENIEVLPYHKLGIEKYKKMGLEYRLKDIPEPPKELVKKTKEKLENRRKVLW